MKQITEIRCSQLSRPMTCAGSLFFEGLPVQDTNDAAKEGTAAGEYLEHLLLASPDMQNTHAKNGVSFDDDMKYYAGLVMENIFKVAKGPILCEQRIDWQTRSGIWIKGQYDASFVGLEGNERKLYIDDLEYGWNIVDVKENWQLLGYAIGEIIRRQEVFPKIVLRIHQPRPHHEDGSTREWEITYDQLLGYKEQIEARFDKIASGFAELVTSPKCKYCPAAPAACTAFNRAVFSGIDHVMSEFKQDDVSDKEVSFQLDLLSRVSDVLKIKKDMLEQLAVSRIKEGRLVPGYLVEQNYGDRKWKKEVSPEVIEVMTGKKIVETVMLSPAKAEKLGVPKDLVATFVDRHFIGVKLKKVDVNALGNAIFGGKK